MWGVNNLSRVAYKITKVHESLFGAVTTIEDYGRLPLNSWICELGIRELLGRSWRRVFNRLPVRRQRDGRSRLLGRDGRIDHWC